MSINYFFQKYLQVWLAYKFRRLLRWKFHSKKFKNQEKYNPNSQFGEIFNEKKSKHRHSIIVYLCVMDFFVFFSDFCPSGYSPTVTEIDPSFLILTLNDLLIDNINNQSQSSIHSNDLGIEVTRDDVINVNISFRNRIERFLSVYFEVENAYVVVMTKVYENGKSARSTVKSGFESGWKYKKKKQL